MIQTAITSTRKTFLKPLAATRNLSMRKSVYDLTAAEVQSLRDAFAKFQAISDNRGYQYVASVHGLNQYFCPHGNVRFLIWHRPYLLMFEQALQSADPGFTLGLPYWDWTSAQAQQEGIPAIFAAKTYKAAGSKKTVANPLHKAAITFKNPMHWTETLRKPGAKSGLAVLPGLVQTANRETIYDRFTSSVEQPHNFVHGWVGGAMGQVPYAAFDPIFWVHHCFIEKLFCDWQDRTSTPISPNIAGQVLSPFNKSTDSVWDYKALGYRYAPEGDLTAASNRAMMLTRNLKAAGHATTFDLSKVPDDLQRADLHFVRTKTPLESFEVRIFFNQPDPSVKTDCVGNPRYAGSVFTFGHGGCTGDPGHCMVPDVPEEATRFATVKPPHHLTPQKLTLNVTKALKRAKVESSAGGLRVDLVLVDHDGKVLPQKALDFELLRLDAI
jgi:tyrosinase